MPTASNKFADDDLVRSILKLKVLLVMDGFDELNEGSEKLIRDIRKTDTKELWETTPPNYHKAKQML